MGRNFRLQRDILDFEKQPFPLVGVWSNYSNNPELGIYDSLLNLVARTATTCKGNGAGSEYVWPVQHEIWSGMNGHLQTQGQIGSSGYGNYWIASTAAVHTGTNEARHRVRVIPLENWQH